MFCYNCVKRWFERTANCPKCRMDMKHPVCGHKATIREMEGGPNFNMHRDLQPILGAGQELPNMCTRCRSDINNNNNRHRLSFFDHAHAHHHQTQHNGTPWYAHRLGLYQESETFLRLNVQYATRGRPPGLPREPRLPPRPAHNDPTPQPHYIGTTCYHCCMRMEMNGQRAFFVHPYAARH
ncbi:hypothetical protein F4782DRAFT_519106 [Xylaria castorea]|nr:hypothetical protein F4782DRAFT_519106 [Xylaria castorea]